jgi:4-amino-4-deoxy-L-arabinose transferase-like glycosyltransferase
MCKEIPRLRYHFARNDKLKKIILKKKLFIFLLLLIIAQALINLIGVLGPEFAFDAVWYHLTLPKIYLLYHKIFYIPGGLFYYSVMPKLTEMLYIGALSFGNEILAKVIHFSFGLLTCFVLYKLSRKFFNQTISLLVVVIFYSNLVVGWESITAYIDLIRAFFEILSLWSFLNWLETQKKKWFVYSAVLLGFAITTKVLAVGSLLIFLVLIFYHNFKEKNKLKKSFVYSIFYSVIALLIPLPWFIFSYVTTGNPVYPFFTKTYAVGAPASLFNPLNFFQTLWEVFTHSPDPLSPVYIAFLPLVLVYLFFRKSITHPACKAGIPPIEGIVILYSFLSLIIWYITPNTGGGRFILPYLPIYSLLIASLFTYSFPRWFKKVLFSIIIFTALISIGYRGFANKKYLPVLLGKETKTQFLTDNLNFSYGDFYDTDNYFATHIKPTDKVLLYGFHNLYYVNFPFVDNSYIVKGEQFNYIAVQHGTIPKRFKNFTLIYQNKKTDVRLYIAKKQWIAY